MPQSLKQSAMSCLLCGSLETEEVLAGVRHAPDTSVNMCKNCSLIFLWPRPSQEELAEYYSGDFRQEYHGEISPARSYNNSMKDAPQRVIRLKHRLKPTMSILDVGAGAGAFLKEVQPFVGSVIGIEPGDAHRIWASQELGIPLVKDIAELGNSKFDLIGLFHTLEHVWDPVEFLRIHARYLVPGGIIAIEVPNVNDALIALYKIPSFPPFYYHKAHLYYFSHSTLAKTIAAAGGRAEITGVQRYDLSNHLHWAINGQSGGQGCYGAVLSNQVQTAYAESLVQAGHSDTLWAIAAFGDDRQAESRT